MTDSDAEASGSETPRRALSRIAPPEHLSRARPFQQNFEADAAERAAIAADFDLASLDRLSFDAHLVPEGKDGWRLDGEMRAAGAQRCGVTLEPVAFDLVAPAVRVWSPDAGEEDLSQAFEIDVDAATAASWSAGTDEDAADVERLPDPLDLGAVALETLALALDPYPRASGVSDFEPVVAGPPGVAPLTDEAAKPFAGLAALKGGASGDEGPRD